MVPAQSSSFGALLKRHRVAAGLSQEALAERAGISTRAVSDLERGLKQTPRRDTVALLAAALELSEAERGAFEAAVHRRRGPGAPAVPAPAPVPAYYSELPGTPFSAAAPHLTPLIGREAEVAAVVHLLLVEGARLLTLTGPGGVGKTRLALAAVAELHDHYADGVHVVSLAPLQDAALVATAMAQTLGLRDASDHAPAAALAAYLRDRATLLVLDNMEHLVAAAPLLVDLLAACPRLALLLTSRVALRLSEEQLVPVPPLALPDPARLPPLEALAHIPAVALFIQRARQVKPDFALTEASASALARICERLDGLPLAIELAAARIRLLPPPALLTRLERRLDLLTDGPRDLPERQHTLRDAIAWSYELLDPPIQALFRRLAAFTGGCTLEAAEAVCGACADGSGAVLDGLSTLVDHSLLRAREGVDGAARVEMLETLREYGLEQLAASGEEDAVRLVHAVHYLDLAERAEPKLLGSEQDLWLARLEEEHNNLRAALAWARDHAGTPLPPMRGERPVTGGALGLCLAGALWRFWYTHGYLDEGRAWLEGMLDITVGDDAAGGAAARARALHGAGSLAHIQGDYARATARYEESLALRRRLGDRQGIAASLNNLGIVADLQGDYVRAAGLYEECLALRRTLGHKQGIAAALHNLAMVVHEQGDRVRATALYEESLALERDMGNKVGVATSLYDLALLAREQGDWTRTAALCTESLTLLRELGDKRGSTHPLALLAHVARRQGDHGRATALYQETLRLRRELGDKRGIAECLEEMAGLAAALGQLRRAAELCGAASALREAIGAPLPPVDRDTYNHTLVIVRAALGDAADAAWTAGHALSLERAVALALADDDDSERG